MAFYVGFLSPSVTGHDYDSTVLVGSRQYVNPCCHYFDILIDRKVEKENYAILFILVFMVVFICHGLLVTTSNRCFHKR